MTARAWHHAKHAAVCDVIEPWAHGTVVRATRYPAYHHFNVVRVEEDPRMGVAALAAFADEALAGLSHRRLDFELVAVAETLRAEFAAAGWQSERLVWMRHELGVRAGPGVPVEVVDYDAVEVLRDGSVEFRAQARQVALRLGVEVLAVVGEGAPIAFAQLERAGAGAEIVEVFVHPDRRGRGLGTALTLAAIGRAGPVDDLWICADDAGRARDLYARLGFRAAWTTIEFLRRPDV